MPSRVRCPAPGPERSLLRCAGWWRAVDFLCGFHLRGSEASGCVGARTLESLRIEMAAARIVDQAVLQTIHGVAGLDHRVVNHPIFGGRNKAGLVFVRRSAHPHRGSRQVGPVVGGRAGDDAVVVVGIALRFLQPLLAARRASVPVGISRVLVVERRDDGLGLERHLVHRAISEVSHFLGMSKREAAIQGTAGVPGVGAGRGVAFLERFHKSGIGDGASPAPVADALEFSVPAMHGGQPDFDLDVGVLAGPQRRGDAAEGGQALGRDGRRHESASRHGEGARGDRSAPW